MTYGNQNEPFKPWWLCYDLVPRDSGSARPIWIFGRWHYLAFILGPRILNVLFGTLKEAEDGAAEYTRYVQAQGAWIAKQRSERSYSTIPADAKLKAFKQELEAAPVKEEKDVKLGGYTVFRLNIEGLEPMYVVQADDGAILKKPFVNWPAALNAIAYETGKPTY
ncbi:hypothetical protein [Muricoccus nepalensis]|uniref:hypothetical protein n=1 Tax=Muricoccus nepalensis TaxID=1854500 RepID=UPI001126F3E4|nr:hypothetical protein [Roseomonas nepalensis]